MKKLKKVCHFSSLQHETIKKLLLLFFVLSSTKGMNIYLVRKENKELILFCFGLRKKEGKKEGILIFFVIFSTKGMHHTSPASKESREREKKNR